jgi:putative FmdB family regulatory protein
MPTYRYRCNSCKHEFDAVQSMMDAPLNTCVKCGKDTIMRLIQPVGIQFKGDGFYINDKSTTSSSNASE